MKKLGLFVAPLMTLSILASCGSKDEPWYKYDNWCDYCSNGIDGSQATKFDIGREVEVKINGVIHKARLIGVDHPIHDGPENATPEAHCTFEFENVICNQAQKTLLSK